MRRHGFAHPFLLAALCATVASAFWAVVAWLDASPQLGCASGTEARVAFAIPADGGQLVHVGGRWMWLARQDEYRLEVWRGWGLAGADFHGAVLTACDLRDADLRHANLRGAFLRECDLTGADLTGADLTGTTFDLLTRWPEGFNPLGHGARTSVGREWKSEVLRPSCPRGPAPRPQRVTTMSTGWPPPAGLNVPFRVSVVPSLL